MVERNLVMAHSVNRKRFKEFMLRRKLNAFGLLSVTVISLVITLICAVTHFKRTDVLIIVSFLLVLLCLIQWIKMRRSFRTLKSSKGFRRKRNKQ